MFIHAKFLSRGVLVLGLLVGCDRVATQSTSITITLPTVAELQKAVGTFSVPLDAANLCFGVNVKNVSKPRPPAKTCDIDREIVAGTVGPGKSLTLEAVESGVPLDFEIYAFQKTATQVCPPFKNSGWGWPLSKVYFIGAARSISVRGAEAQVEIQYRLSDVTQNIVAQNSWPSSCLSTISSQKDVGRVLTGATVLTSANYRLPSKISPFNSSLHLNGTNYKVRHGKVSP